MTIFFSWAIKRTLSAFWRNFPYHFHHLSSAKGFSWKFLSPHQTHPSESDMTSQPTPPTRNSCFTMRFWVRPCLASYSTPYFWLGFSWAVGAVTGSGWPVRSWWTVLGPQTDGATRFTKSTNISMMASGTSLRGVLSYQMLKPPQLVATLCSSFLGGEPWPSKGSWMLMTIRTIRLVVLGFCFQKTTFKMIQLILLVTFNSWLFMDMMVQKCLKPRAPPVMAKYFRSKHPVTTNLNWFAGISKPSNVLSLNVALASFQEIVFLLRRARNLMTYQISPFHSKTPRWKDVSIWQICNHGLVYVHISADTQITISRLPGPPKLRFGMTGGPLKYISQTPFTWGCIWMSRVCFKSVDKWLAIQEKHLCLRLHTLKPP